MKQTISCCLSAGILALLPLLAGCLNVEKSFPEKRYFILDVPRHGNLHLRGEGVVLRVRKFHVSPRYRGKGFVYRKGDLSYESDFYNRFFILPSSLITEEVSQWLASSGLFQNVVSTTSQLETTHVLEGVVNALYGDYSRQSPARAVLEIQFFLIKDVSARSEIVFQKKYRKEVVIEESSPESLVKGWNKALRQILTDLEENLRQVDIQKAS